SKSGYGLEDADLAMIICMRHFSTSFAFNDATWAKYGKPLADEATYPVPAGAEPPTANPLIRGNANTLMMQLAKRGVHFAICDLATHFLAGRIAKAVGGNADDIYRELAANTVGTGHFVAAGVIGATRAQEYGYALIVAG